MDDLREIWSWIKSIIEDLFPVASVPPIMPIEIDYFAKAMKYTLPNEGVYSNLPHGGPTKYGITQDTLSRWRGQAVSAKDVQSLELDQAKAIYRKWYWDDVGLSNIHNQTSIAIFDMGVNMGPATAVKLAQRALNQLLSNQLTVDGVLGPLTAHALNLINIDQFAHRFQLQVISSYRQIVAADETQSVNLNGWINRADRLLSLIS